MDVFRQLPEAFLRLAREVRERQTPDNVAAWLFRVTSNLATSRARRAAVAARFADSLDRPETDPGPEAATLDGERYEALREALRELTPTDRTALLMAAHGYRGPEDYADLPANQRRAARVGCNLWRPSAFAADWALLEARLRRIAAQHIVIATIPSVTIAVKDLLL